MKYILGCWHYDPDMRAMLNTVTGERVVMSSVQNDAVGAPEWLFFSYVSEDIEFPAAARIRNVSGQLGGGNRNTFEIDLRAATRVWLGGASPVDSLPYGVWQRVSECVPEALLLWPQEALGLPLQLTGWGTMVPRVQQVHLLGGWANGRFRPDMIETIDGQELLGRYLQRFPLRDEVGLLERKQWPLAALNAEPQPSLHFVDVPNPAFDVAGSSLWSEPHPGQNQESMPLLKRTRDLVPHVTSDDDTRYMFFTKTRPVRGEYFSEDWIFAWLRLEWGYFFFSISYIPVIKGPLAQDGLRYTLARTFQAAKRQRDPGPDQEEALILECKGWPKVHLDRIYSGAAATDRVFRLADRVDLPAPVHRGLDNTFSAVKEMRMRWQIGANREIRQAMIDVAAAWAGTTSEIPGWSSSDSQVTLRRAPYLTPCPLAYIHQLSLPVPYVAGIVESASVQMDSSGIERCLAGWRRTVEI